MLFGLQNPSAIRDEEEIPEDVKREMLPEICKGVVTLMRESQAPGGCSYVYLVGTAHVSKVLPRFFSVKHCPYILTLLIFIAMHYRNLAKMFRQ